MHLKIKTDSEKLKKLYEQRDNHSDDSGFDLYVTNDIVVPFGLSSATINFSVAVAAYDDNGNNIPFMLVPRSSISKTPIRMSNSIGIIDKGYRGQLMAKIDNMTIDLGTRVRSASYKINKHARLFQIVSFDGSPITYEFVEELDETARGAGGFGSTGE